MLFLIYRYYISVSVSPYMITLGIIILGLVTIWGQAEWSLFSRFIPKNQLRLNKDAHKAVPSKEKHVLDRKFKDCFTHFKSWQVNFTSLSYLFFTSLYVFFQLGCSYGIKLTLWMELGYDVFKAHSFAPTNKSNAHSLTIRYQTSYKNFPIIKDLQN